MIMYAKIKRMYFREKLSINEIARRTSLSRNTVKKWLRAEEGSEPQYHRQAIPTKLSPYEEATVFSVKRFWDPTEHYF